MVVEGNGNIPFKIKRVFYIYSSDKNVVRGQHANRKTEFVLPVSIMIRQSILEIMSDM